MGNDSFDCEGDSDYLASGKDTTCELNPRYAGRLSSMVRERDGKETLK
jgi:hypothetical protein